MRLLPILLLAFAAGALAQQPPDAAEKSDASKAAARVRVDGAAGGTGDAVAQGQGQKHAIEGKTNRRDLRPEQARDGRVHDEHSSDREAGRGARGSN